MSSSRSEDADRRLILDRANRMLQQSRTLRRLSDELLQESKDIRKSARRAKLRKPRSHNKDDPNAT